MLQTSLIGLLFGTVGTTLGGIIGIVSKRTSNKFISFVLSFASGIMLAIVCFSLIPEAMEIADITSTTIGIILGVTTMIFCDILIKNIFKKNNTKNKSINDNTHLINENLIKTGIIISIGIALHNIPEGLAIGSGFDSSPALGLSLAIAICMHDVPEGISMAIPLKKGGMNKVKIIVYVILSGIATGVGAALGALIGNISTEIIAISLAFAAGAMLYIVSGELIPEYNELYKGRTSSLAIILGLILGILFK